MPLIKGAEALADDLAGIDDGDKAPGVVLPQEVAQLQGLTAGQHRHQHAQPGRELCKRPLQNRHQGMRVRHNLRQRAATRRLQDPAMEQNRDGQRWGNLHRYHYLDQLDHLCMDGRFRNEIAI